jgi:hypothetical protein
MHWTYNVPGNVPKYDYVMSLDGHPHVGALTAMGILPLSRRFSLFARAGAAHWSNDVTLDINEFNLGYEQKATATKDSNNFIWGGGASVYVVGVLLRAEYEQMRPTAALFDGYGRGSVDGRWRLITLSAVVLL